MDPQLRFTLDLLGLFASVLVMIIALLFVPVFTVRAWFAMLSLLFIALAWGCSFWSGVTDGAEWASVCVVFMTAAGLMLGLSLAMVALS